MNWAYLVRCRDDSLYAGWTPDLPKRLAAHNAGTGAKYTRGRGPVILAYAESFATKSEAMARESAFKRLNKAQKEALAKNWVPPSLGSTAARTLESLPGGTQIYTDKNHRIGTDSLLLLDFCTAWRNWSVCDLGTGGGILLLGLIDKGLRGKAVGIDIDSAAISLLRESASLNEFLNLQSIQEDWRKYRPARPFDLVVSNPPYFTSGPLPPNPQRASARHQLIGNIEDVCACASRILKDGGRFCLCYPAASLASLFFALHSHNLEPKQLQFVRKSPENEPHLALVDARKAGGSGLAVLPDRILPPGQSVHY